MIGALLCLSLWVANISRPDISFAVSTLARFTVFPEYAHMRAALRILGYHPRRAPTMSLWEIDTGHAALALALTLELEVNFA